MDVGILSLTRFGDLIQTTPVVKGLRERYPSAKLHLIVKRRFREVAELLPEIDVIHELDGDALAATLGDPRSGFLDRFRKLGAELEPLTRLHFDSLFDLTHSRSSAALVSLLDVDRRVGFTLDRRGRVLDHHPWLAQLTSGLGARRLWRFNIVDVFLGAAGLTGLRQPVSVRVPEVAREAARRALPTAGPWLAVQLGASTDAKTWSAERFAATLRRLAEHSPDIRVVLVGVRAEQEQSLRLQAQCPGVRFENLVGQTRIDELAALLERVDLLLTCDTGTMHLAAAVGTPTCAVFVGLGSPYETAPYAEGHWVIASRIDCAPCGFDVACAHSACHDDVPPEWLAELLRRRLRRAPVDGLAAAPRADLFETRFDDDGLLELLPLYARPPARSDLLAAAYRPALLQTLEAIPPQSERVWRQVRERYGVEPSEWRARLPEELPRQLESLSDLARRGDQVSDRLADPRGTGAGTHELAKQLVEIDEAIYSITRSEPLLAPLGLSHESDRSSLPDSDLPELAALTGPHYRALSLRVGVLRELIG